MRSADPMKTSGPDSGPSAMAGPPELANAKMRECSRNRPRMDRTRMFSLSPGTPGRIAQIPRTTRSTFTPACDAR
ncbi:hypothetical protein D3C74_381750 [compost metagenome]